MSQENIAIVIPAGGGGTRLWPRSRQATPKQFLDIVRHRTMLQETADRVADLADPANVFIITNASHVGPVREQLPGVPPENVVGEPEGRDSAPAIGLMAALLEHVRGEETVMCVLPADHVILRDDHFRDVLRYATRIAGDGYLVTLGIPPSRAHTGFGYIQRSEAIGQDEASGVEAYTVRHFREKPSREVAERYLEEGGFYWNAGMYIAQVKTFRDLYRTHLPQLEDGFARAVEALRTGDSDAFAEVFPTLEKISIDYGIAERAERVAVIPADIGWNDVGSWANLAEVLASEEHEANNIVVGEHVGIDTTGSLIYSPHRLIATIGLEDIVVIDTPDATLICPKSRSEEVKRVVEMLKARGDHHLL